MILKQIVLKNFQIHKSKVLDLDEFTGLIGWSSSGKTSVMRGLRWLFFGEWDKTYPNDPEEETAVAVKFADGTFAARYRKGNKNRAAVKFPDGRVLKYEDFGDSIPGLLDIVRLAPIKIGPREVNLNFSLQDEPIFMVTETGPTRAQWLGRLYGAHTINHMLRLMATDKRRLEGERKSLEADAESLKARMAGYKGLDEAEAHAKTARGLLESLAGLEACKDDLVSIYREHEALKSKGGLLTADTSAIRLDLVNLQTLEGLRKLRDEVLAAQAAADAKKSLLGLNPVEIRRDLERLRTLQSLREEYLGSESRLKVAQGGLAKAGSAHAEAMKEVRGNLFKDGRCPVCLHKHKKLDVEAAASRLRELTSGGQ